MITGSNEHILSPIRTINGKVEVLDTSTETKSGAMAVRLDGCTSGEKLSVQLSSRNLVDMTKATNGYSAASILEKTSNYVLAQGKAGNTPGIAAFSNGEIVFPLEKPLETGKTYSVVYDIEFIEKMGEFDLPTTMMIILGTGRNVNAFNGMGTYQIRKTYTISTNSSPNELIVFTHSCKIKISNVCVVEGNSQVYSPYTNSFEGYEVTRYGKNLFDYTQYPFTNHYVSWQSGNVTSSSGYSCSGFIPCSHLQGQTITLNHPPIETGGGNPGMSFYSDTFENWDASGVWLGDGGAENGYTAIVPEGANYFRFSVPRAYADGTQIQIELGDTVTDYEAYSAPIVLTADATGKAETTSLPTTTIFAEAAVTANYIGGTVATPYTNRDKLKSVQIDRVGESKFFGFGISQKATIEFVDKDCTCELAKGDKLTVSFDDAQISPIFCIEEVKRNQVNNELTVTALDAICASANHTYNELGISSYTLGELASAIAKVLKVGVVIPSLEEFSISYPEGGNFEGSETLREVLNAIAEATQTIYYINYQNVLTFKRLDNTNPYTIDRSQYIELEAQEAVTLAKIVNATELGDNLEATTGTDGATQTIYNNPLLELREDLATLLETAIDNVGGASAVPFTCTWRGNYLVEPTDAVSIVAKDGSALVSFLIGDTITYNGGYKQVSEWAFENEESANNNPTTLGEAIKQTYAKVDKANKNIEIVTSEAQNNKSEIAAIRADTDSISASVVAIDKKVNESTEALNGSLTELTSKVNATMTSEEIKLEIATELSNGVDKVVTEKGYTFDDEGLKVTSSGNSFTTTISENGMIVREGSKDMLIADNEGVTAVDLHAKTFLIIGDYSRLQNYPGEKRTACFWIGG